MEAKKPWLPKKALFSTQIVLYSTLNTIMNNSQIDKELEMTIP